MKILRASCLAAFMAASLSAGTIDPSADDSQHVDYGMKFPYVDKLTCSSVGTGVVSSATCVLISPHWFLTAAHVVAGCDRWVVEVDGKEHIASKVVIHEDYSEENLGHGDLAMGYCPTDFGLDFYPGLYTGRDEVGKTVSICGYGFFGTHSTGAKTHDGKRRAGSNIVERTERSVLMCSVHEGRKTQLEFLISCGDSGGGLFVGNQLAGLNSFLSSKDGKPKSLAGEESAHTRISLYAEWINARLDSK